MRKGWLIKLSYMLGCGLWGTVKEALSAIIQGAIIKQQVTRSRYQVLFKRSKRTGSFWKEVAGCLSALNGVSVNRILGHHDRNTRGCYF